MPFNMIVPVPKAKTGKLTIACAARQSGAHYLMLSIPHTIWTVNFGAAETCDVHIGQGADEGKMLLAAVAAGGHFKPTFFKTNILLRLTETDWTPQFKMPAIDPEHRQTKDGLLITLPEWAWKKEVQTGIAKARSQVAREKQLDGRGGK